MALPDLKQLKALVALCRKMGVTTLRHDGMEIVLGEPPVKEQPKKLQTGEPANTQHIETDSLTDMDLLFWSATSEKPMVGGEEESNES